MRGAFLFQIVAPEPQFGVQRRCVNEKDKISLQIQVETRISPEKDPLWRNLFAFPGRRFEVRTFGGDDV